MFARGDINNVYILFKILSFKIFTENKIKNILI